MSGPDRRVFRQGDLDGLCGLYAVVHVLTRLLGPAFRRHDLPRDVFREAARAIPRRRYPAVLWDGTSPAELLACARAACRWVERETGLGVDVARPFLRRRYESRDAFIDAIIEQIRGDRGTDFILWVDWPPSHGSDLAHWTVFAGVDDRQLRLIDSAGKPHLQTRGMRIDGDRGLRLDPRWTLMFDFARIDGVPRPRDPA